MTIEYKTIIGNMKCGTRSNKRDALQFSILKEDRLISRAEIIRIDLSIANCLYRALVVCGVLTVPSFRNKGHGTQLIKTMTAHIAASDSDVGMLFCRSELSNFYAVNNWESCSKTATRIGTPENYRLCEMERLMILVSENSRNSRFNLIAEPLYIESAW